VTTKLRPAAVLGLLIFLGCAQAQSGPGSLLILPPLTADGYAQGHTFIQMTGLRGLLRTDRLQFRDSQQSIRSERGKLVRFPEPPYRLKH
jgi:hypothetical protein